MALALVAMVPTLVWTASLQPLLMERATHDRAG
jgi:hypothetical protein